LAPSARSLALIDQQALSVRTIWLPCSAWVIPLPAADQRHLISPAAALDALRDPSAAIDAREDVDQDRP